MPEVRDQPYEYASGGESIARDSGGADEGSGCGVYGNETQGCRDPSSGARSCEAQCGEAQTGEARRSEARGNESHGSEARLPGDARDKESGSGEAERGEAPSSGEAPGGRAENNAARDRHRACDGQSLLHEALGLDTELWWLVHAGGALDRQLALGLASLWDNDRFRPLGFVRATDFIREHLGIETDRAYWLARLGRALRDLPEFDHALTAGRINASQVVELSRIVSSASPATERRHWLERAAQTSCRALRREVEREIERRRGEKRQGTDPEGSERLDPTLDPNGEPEGGWMSIPAPARVAVLWDHAADLACAVAGHQLSRSQSAELIFADYLSSVGNESPEETAAIAGERRDRELAELLQAMNRPPRTRARAADREKSDEHEHSTVVDWQAPEQKLPADCVVGDGDDPWGLAAILKRLCTLAQVIRYDLARLLDRLRTRAQWRVLGFRSFAAYCAERLGFGRRHAEQMIRFGRGLDRFERLKESYLGGRVTYTAALKLLPVLHAGNEEEWVTWAEGVTYRELEKAAEYARMFSLPDASPRVLEQWWRQLAKQERARRGGGQDANAFQKEDGGGGPEAPNAFQTADGGGAPRTPNAFQTADGGGGPEAPNAFQTAEIPDLPLGVALPPSAPGARPTISGIPNDLSFTDPELCVARIRFWLPTDALELAHRALCRCRLRFPSPSPHTWVHLELILVHFIHSQDTPLARDIQRRHKTIARDNFQCICPVCTSRSSLNEHHLEHKAQGVCNEPWNLATLCAGHHQPGVHGGVMEMGGWAPDDLAFRLGIDPRTGRAFASYVNGRRVSEDVAREVIRKWKEWWWERRRGEENQNPIDGEQP